jgi:drug/metabolite transporter (DMT)-like permease
MKRNYWAAVALISVAAVWGAAFVLMKDAIERQPLFDFLAFRFTIATLIMIAARPKVLKAIDKDLLKKGILLGLMLGGGYITQTIGLSMSTAAITGFITGLYVVVTPVLGWMILGRKAGKKVIWGVGLATVGLALISINGVSIEIGQIWVILCAILFAAHITGLGAWSGGLNSYALTVVQLAVVALISWIGAAPDGIQAPVDFSGWFAIIFTAVFATAVAFFVQTWAQSHMDASRVAIILTSEVVFAAVIAVAVGQEVLKLKTILGGLIMIAAMLLVEWPSRKTRSADIIK